MRSWAILVLLTGFLSFAQDKGNTLESDLKPIKIYDSEGVKIASYDFNSFDPILHKNDNTLM